MGGGGGHGPWDICTESPRPSQGFWGTGERRHIFQGNKGPKMRGTGEQRQFWGTGNKENQDFIFGEQGSKAIYFRGTRELASPPPPASPCDVQRHTHTAVLCILCVFSTMESQEYITSIRKRPVPSLCP